MIGLALVLAFAAGATSAQSRPERDYPTPTEMIYQIERRVTRVLLMLGQARRDGIELRTRCVDAVASQTTAALRVAEYRERRAQLASERGDEEGAARERALIRYSYDRAIELEHEARMCLDPQRPARDGTRVVTTIDPRVPDDALREDLPRGQRLGAIHDP